MLKRLFFAGLITTAVGIVAQPASSQTEQTDRLPETKLSPAHHPQYLARSGKRKPPGAALDAREGMTPLLEQQEQDIDKHTLKSICKDAPGCEGGHLYRRR